MASFIVIPMALLIQGEAVMLFWGNDQVLWLAVAGVSVLTVLMARVGIAHFQREALLGREIDVLNLRWVGRVFWQSFTGGARTPWGWYRTEVRATLRRQAPAIWLTLALGILSVVVGYSWIQSYRALVPEEIFGELGSILPAGVDMPSLGGLSYTYILGHNLRAVAVISLLGMVSFGTLGALMYFLNAAVIGVVLSLMGVMGFSPWKVAVFGILPHGIFEITALVLSSAAVLYGAVLLVTPRSQRSLGEIIIEAIADWTRIFVGLVVPLLAIAAAVETWVTPVLLSTFGK
ncbi:MAG: stage II sporulation protein M [Chloroflexi bacterium]|nr:stage II sporulation protein M [Chloroflexota bacterium]